MARLSRFENYRFIGNRLNMKVYDCDNLEEFNEDLYGYISRLIMQTYKERNNNFDLADAADEAYKLYNDWARQLTVIEDDYIKCSGEGKPWWRNRTRQIGAAQARWRGK